MNIYRRKDKQNHKETKKHKHADKRKNSHSVSQKLVKQTAFHSSHSQAVKQTVTQSSQLLLFDSNKQSDRTVTQSINRINKQLLISDSTNLLIFPHFLPHPLFHHFPLSLPSFSLILCHISFLIALRPLYNFPHPSSPYLFIRPFPISFSVPNSLHLILFSCIQFLKKLRIY